jgi:hypothetical protein
MVLGHKGPEQLGWGGRKNHQKEMKELLIPESLDAHEFLCIGA